MIFIHCLDIEIYLNYLYINNIEVAGLDILNKKEELKLKEKMSAFFGLFYFNMIHSFSIF